MFLNYTDVVKLVWLYVFIKKILIPIVDALFINGLLKIENKSIELLEKRQKVKEMRRREKEDYNDFKKDYEEYRRTKTIGFKSNNDTAACVNREET